MNLQEQIEFYKNQNVYFPFGDEDYISIQKADVNNNLSHFYSLRQKAQTEAEGRDFFGVVLNNEVWLFPVSQKHLKGLYHKVTIGGDIDVEAFSNAVGWAPIGMPFVGMTEHWHNLRSNVAGVFHDVFMNKYFENFNVATQHALENLKEGETISIYDFMHKLTYESASIGLFGGLVDVSLHEEGKEKDVTVRELQEDVIHAYIQHAVEPEFYQDEGYRLNEKTLALQQLNKNYTTIAGAVQGLAVA